jgi:hypothetical protein
MNAEQPDYSKLPQQFQFGVENGKTKNLFEKSGDLVDGKKKIAHLIDTVVLLNSSLIDEVEKHTALREKHQRALSKAEEIHLEWADLSKRQLERIDELQKELAELKDNMKFLDLDGKPCDRCSEPVCYEGNEGKISKRDDCVICEECYTREEVEDNPNPKQRRFWVKPKTGILKD